MQNLTKFLISVLTIIILSLGTTAFNFNYFDTGIEAIYNPFTGDIDYIRTSNFTGENITAYSVTVEGNIKAGEFSGNIDWTNLQNYPSACPNNNAITQLDDSVTCSDDWINEAGDTMTGNLVINANLTIGEGTIYWNGSHTIWN